MSNTDNVNQDITTELEITGGIITFALILIGVITVIIILKNQKQRRNQQFSLPNAINPGQYTQEQINHKVLGPNIGYINKTFGTNYRY